MIHFNILSRWYKATNASDKKKDKIPKNCRRKIQMTPKQEEVLWRAFVSHLQNNVRCCAYFIFYTEII